MVKVKWLVILVLLVTTVQPSLAEDRAQVQGAWNRYTSFLLVIMKVEGQLGLNIGVSLKKAYLTPHLE